MDEPSQFEPTRSDEPVESGDPPSDASEADTVQTPMDPSLLAWQAPIAGESEVGDRLGPFRLESLLGQGGFGMVYLAEQLEPVKRKVAIKLIKPGMDTRQVIARFRVEQQTLASLEHPSIARIFDAGVTPKGRPYFAMEYVEGESISSYCRTHRLPVRDVLRLVVKVCEGVQYAHQRGVIHRDLKPSNILVTRIDGVASPKIIDFGIAKAITEEVQGDVTRQTVQGQILGTPEYMSPEQAELGPAAVDTRSDVYSVGAVLYELLTGERPFDARTLRKASTDELKRAIREMDPPRPSTMVLRTRTVAGKAKSRQQSAEKTRALSRRLRGDLDWITMRAMHKDRDLRYESASAFAEDIRRHVTGRPVLAGPPSVMYRARKFVRRNRGAVSTAALVGIALLVGLGLFIGQSIRVANLNVSLKKTNADLTVAKADLEKSEGELKVRNLELQQTIEELDDEREKLELSNAALVEREEQLRVRTEEAEIARDEAEDAEGRAVVARNHAQREQRRAMHAAYANEVARGVDALEAERLSVFVRAIEEGRRLGPLNDWAIGALHAEFDQSMTAIGLGQFDTTAARILPDGRLVLLGDRDGSLRLLDPFAQRVEPAFGGGGGPVARIEVAYRAPRAATMSRSGVIQVWDLEQRRLIQEHRVLTDTPSAIALSAGGQWLAIGDIGGRVTIRDAASGEPIQVRPAHQTSVQTLAFSPDDLWLLSASQDHEIARFTTSGWVVKKASMRLEGIVRAIAFAGDDRFLTGDESGAVIEWSLLDHKPMRVVERGTDEVRSLAHRQGLVAGGTADLAMRVWWPASGEERTSALDALDASLEGPTGFGRRTLTGHTSYVEDVRWVVGEPLGLLSIDAGFVVRTWQLGLTDPMTQSPMLHDSEIVSLAQTPDQRVLLSASADGSLRAWDAQTMRAHESSPRLRLNGRAIAMGVDAESAYVLDQSGALRRWDPESGSVLNARVFDGPAMRALAVRVRDGLVLLGDDAGTIHLVDGLSLRTIREIKAHAGPVNAIAVSQDGRRAVSVGDDGEAIAWELERFTFVRRAGGFGNRLVACAIDPKGSAFAVGDETGFVYVYEIDAGAIEEAGERRHDARWSIGGGVGSSISALAFSPDGAWLASADRAGVVMLWASDFRHPVARLARGELGVGALAFAPDNRLLGGRGDGRVRIWRSGIEQPRLEAMALGERLPINAAIVDAYCVDLAGQRIVPVVGESFSIQVHVRTSGLAGSLLEITRDVNGEPMVSRESAGTRDEDLRFEVSGAWVPDRAGVHEATVGVRVLGEAIDQVPSDDTLTIRFLVRE